MSGAPRGRGGPSLGAGRRGAGRCGGGGAEGGGPMARPLAGPASPPSLSVSSRRPPAPRGLVPGGPRAEGGAGPEGGCDGPGGVELVVRGVPGGGRLDRDRSKLAGEGAPSAAKLLAGGRDGHAVAGVRHPPLVECVRRGVRRPCPPRRPPRLPGPASSSPSLRCPLSLTPAPASCLAPSAVPGPLGPRPDPLGLQLPSTPACLATTPVPLFSPR